MYGHKRERVLYTALGHIFANLIQMLLITLGMGVIITSSVLAFNLLNVFGIASEVPEYALKSLYSKTESLTRNLTKKIKKHCFSINYYCF